MEMSIIALIDSIQSISILIEWKTMSESFEMHKIGISNLDGKEVNGKDSKKLWLHTIFSRNMQSRVTKSVFFIDIHAIFNKNCNRFQFIWKKLHRYLNSFMKLIFIWSINSCEIRVDSPDFTAKKNGVTPFSSGMLAFPPCCSINPIISL